MSSWDAPPRITITLTGGDTLELDPSTPDGSCQCCGRELEPAETRLEMTLAISARETAIGMQTIRVCRPCIAEHSPDLLALLERDTGELASDTP